MDAVKDYMSLTKRYPRLSISPEFSKVYLYIYIYIYIIGVSADLACSFVINLNLLQFF